MVSMPLTNHLPSPKIRHGVFFAALLVCAFPAPGSRAGVPPSGGTQPQTECLNPPQTGFYPYDDTAVGDNALCGLLNNQGWDNTAVGFYALTANNGSQNTAIGSGTLTLNDYGSDNTASGNLALSYNYEGSRNTATGSFALYDNDYGNENTAAGYAAMVHNNGGSDNTATGIVALFTNVMGSYNTATGASALLYNIADNNTADGAYALLHNSVGTGDVATGAYSLLNNNASYNTADGFQALYSNVTGMQNAATGYNALYYSTGDFNTAIGSYALYHLASGSNNIAVGGSAGANLGSGSYNIDIGHAGVAAESNTIRLGTPGASTGQTATYIAGIYSQPVFGQPKVVRIDNTGKLGTALGSSARFKEAIKPMDKASEVILALEPVTFRYKHQLDPTREPQFGLVAEQVEKVNPDLVERDAQGKPDTVRYEAVNAMLLNEFLKEHRKVAEQGTTISQLRATAEEQQKEIKALTASLKEQAGQIQKVSAQLAADRPAPRLVSSGQ